MLGKSKPTISSFWKMLGLRLSLLLKARCALIYALNLICLLSVTKDCCRQTKKHIKKHNRNDTTAERGKAVMTNKFYSHHPSLSSNSWREEEDTIAEKEGGRWLDCCRSARNGLIGPTDNILATNS